MSWEPPESWMPESVPDGPTTEQLLEMIEETEQAIKHLKHANSLLREKLADLQREFNKKSEGLDK